MIKTRILLTVLLLMPLQAWAQMFNPTTFTLANGLEIVVVENHRAPIVTHMVWYKVGSADEVPGKSGLAHLLEHMMFKGTPTLPPGEFSKTIARSGGRDNAFTSSDYTAYFQNIAADHLDLAMKLESDRMHNLTFDQKNFETERAVVMEERRSRTDNNPGASLMEWMQAGLYLNHPYHRPVIGWESEIAHLTRDDALEFYRKWYAPNNAILVVAGDLLRPHSPCRHAHSRPAERAAAGGGTAGDAQGSTGGATQPDPHVSGPQLSLRRQRYRRG